MATSSENKNRIKPGPRAIIECTEQIPCNPCESSCRSGAIQVGEPMTNLPRFSPEKCNGCGLCVASCPGLAIFLIDDTSVDDQANVTLPFEYLPLPKKGEVVLALDRMGKPVCEARVVRVQTSRAYNRTALVTIEVPRPSANVVRAIKVSRW